MTGLGAVTPIGIGKENFWSALIAGKNGIGKITRFDATNHTVQIAGEVPDFDPAQFIDKKELKRMDRYTQFALAAARLAIEDSKLDLEKIDGDRAGVFVGTGIGGMDTLHNQYEKLFTKGASRISPFFIPMAITNMAAGNVAITFGLRGPCECIVTACASGTNSIGDAFRVIERGEADIMLAGGSEAAISPAGVAGFAYYSGFGWPTQESVVEGLFEQSKDGGDVSQYVSSSLSDDARDQVIAQVPTDATSVSINAVERSMSNSSVDVTATLAEGGEQSYTVSLVRDGIGWKVSDVNPRYASLGDDAAVETQDDKEDESEDAKDEQPTEDEEQPAEETAPAEGEQEAPAEGAEQNDDAATSEGTVTDE